MANTLFQKSTLRQHQWMMSTKEATMITMKIIHLFLLLILLNSPSCRAIGVAGKEAAEEEVHVVPSFSVSDLQTGRRYGELIQALTSTGLISITPPEDNEFETARSDALTGLCHCASSSEDFSAVEGTDSILLGDGQTVRSTLATATVGTNSPLPLPSKLDEVCGAETTQSLDALRDQVAYLSQAFIQAFDQVLARERQQDPEYIFYQAPTSNATILLRNSYGGFYHSVSSIVQASSNLEHFHYYSKPTRRPATEEDQKPALELHTDAGLFLSFVPALQCRDTSSGDQSFYLQTSAQRVQRAVFPPNSVAIMLGAGAEHWLKTPSTLSLKATRHSVQMHSGDSRAWYGMSKYLASNMPPMNALEI
jgi:hypothetical protein